MMHEEIMILAYNLLAELNIRHMRVTKDRLELYYNLENQQIIAYGNTEEELVENFYLLYQELLDLNRSTVIR